MRNKPAPGFKVRSVLLRTPLLPLKAAYSPIAERDPLFETGLFLASKALYVECLKRALLPESGRLKLERSLAKYSLRASTRATPFATFAGVSVVGISPAPTSLIRDVAVSEHVKLRPDMEVVIAVVNRLLRYPEVARQLRFHINNSLYKAGDDFRYAEFRIDNGLREYQLVSVEDSPELSALIHFAKSPRGYSELERILAERTSCSADEICDYLGEAIESQILISELEPALTGRDALAELLQRISGLDGLAPERALLEELQNVLRSGTTGVDTCRTAGDIIGLIAGAKGMPDNMLQADFFPAMVNANLNQSIVDKMLQQTEALMVFAEAPERSSLDDFKDRFRQRYEDRLIPLSLALDADLGLGYAGSSEELTGSLVDDLPVSGRAGNESIIMTPQRLLALRKYEDWMRDGGRFVELTDGDLSAVENTSSKPRLPDSMYLMGTLLKRSGSLNEHDFHFDLSAVGGPSAANLLGRFAYGDARIEQLCRALADDEAAFHPELIFAEIVHLPQARTGNILLRPQLREYEIPYIGISAAPLEKQIPADDLWIRIHAGEIQLWSKKHNRRIIPRLTTAHNFGHNSLPVYRFLCDLQSEGLASLRLWDWGLLAEMRKLPRVVYKNIILRKARWTAILDDFEIFCPQQGVELWRVKMSVPDRVVYVDGDNELLIDFTEPVGREIFMQYLHRHRKIRLEEFLHDEGTAVVHDRDGYAFANELIIPFTRMPRYERAPGYAPFDDHRIQRSFPPGSEWICYKIYCGVQTAEGLLRAVILPWVEDLLDRGLCSRFFFVRYKDDAAHIRLRFLSADPEKRQQLQVSSEHCFGPLLEKELVHNIVCATYKRELERYGSVCIEATEQLFHNDSLAMLRVMHLLESPSEESYRSLLALRSVDTLLNDFGLSLAEKLGLLKRLQRAFFQESGASPALQKKLNELYRKHQRDIFLHMDAENDESNSISEAVQILALRTLQNGPVIAELKAVAEASWQDLLPDFIHMSLNRLFVAMQRRYELVVYHFLEKYYSSMVARCADRAVRNGAGAAS
jgi:thiopeptide-type bacteriocin biosynthesis protein